MKFSDYLRGPDVLPTLESKDILNKVDSYILGYDAKGSSASNKSKEMIELASLVKDWINDEDNKSELNKLKRKYKNDYQSIIADITELV